MAWEIVSPPQTCPVGTIFWFPSNTPSKLPTDWAYCDGASANSAAETSPGVANPYRDLFNVIGYTYGGSGATFNLPDLRGKFVRGWSGAGGTAGAIDAPRTFGSTQLSSVISHTHQFTGLGHYHNPISIVDPGHNHSARTATVIGPNRGYYGNKDTGPDLMSDGVDVTGVTMVLADFDPAVLSTPPTVYKQTLTNTAPVPTDETKPVNFPLVPIIRYTYGSTPPIPNPNPYFYYVSVSPTSMGASATATVTVLTANVARGTTLYWELGGPGVDASLFNPATLTGSVTIGYNNVATFSVTSAASLPTPPYSVEIKIYSDSARLNQVGNTAYLSLT
jgi:microcystin-dependent protein